MCAPVCHSGCFVFGVIVNILLLALTIWAAKSQKPFAVWVSLLVTFLFCFVYQVTITLARLRDGPRHNSSYAVPLSNSDIEMLTYNSPRLRPRNSLPEDSPPTDAFRLRPVSEDVQQNALYQRMLEERPLPPIPARNPSRPSIYSAVLASPLSDPFINGSALPQPIRLSAREGGVTIRQVPPSSYASRI
ncbi:hypothetical protein D6C86_06038 [Aureobasidium pullulans]|uniref:Uncharacterized protein n=1 Tax=Aureobasidium pullulans TaxID=5580 RepID=A0A4S9V565_AURPU|nr:hypothetical protein D6C94_06581 [Aureobasidium pullulans]THZ45987.1 hypothetical protein D6C87_02472 [Aureobasidium pullulans]THZ58961.1 hypothetical protein D6C86_06038 [Aureobasidium pullulans]